MQGNMNIDFKSNPFLALLNQNGQSTPQQGNGMYQMPGGSMMNNEEMEEHSQSKGANMGVAAGGSDYINPAEEQLMPGKNPSKSTNLVKAITALESVATASTDKNEIALIRGLISAISRLMGNDQEALRSII